MKLLDFIPRKGISASLKAADRKGVVNELAALLKKAHPTGKINVQDVATAVLERETKVGSTGLGGGVAIPHARVDAVQDVVGVFGRTVKPLDFSAVDGDPVSLFFLIVSPASMAKEYATALEKVAHAIKRPNFCKFLRAARTAREIEEIFKDAEETANV